MWRNKRAVFYMTLIVVLTLISICGPWMLRAEYAKAYSTWNCWVMCQPDSRVCIRSEPSLGGKVLGWAYAGDQLQADDYTQNGWIHCIDLPVEAGEGWICMDYVTETAPVDEKGSLWRVDANGRVAVREGIGGPRVMWLQPGTEVQVYLVAGEWAVTSCGFVRVMYLQEGVR